MFKIFDLLVWLFELVTGCVFEFDGGMHLAVVHPYRMVFSGLVTFALAVVTVSLI